MTIYNQPNPTEAQVREELTTEFDFKPYAAGFLDECVQIALYLSDPKQVEVGVIELEKRLQNRVDNRADEVVKHYKARAAPGGVSTLDAKLKHLLSQELSQWEIQWGFNSFAVPAAAGEAAVQYRTGEKVQTYAKFISANAFRNEVQLKRHWKDPSIPGMHGEYTHRLQWFLIGIQLRGDIKRQVSDVFSEIGRVTWDKGSLGLWDPLCDRVSEGVGGENFSVAQAVLDGRSPESLTKFIVDPDNEPKFPILHWFITSRLKKRTGVTGMDHHGNRFAYIGKKLKKFGLPNADEDVRSITGHQNKEGGARGGGTGVFRSGAPIQH